MTHPATMTGEQISAAISAGYRLAKSLPPADAEAVTRLCQLVDCYHGAVIRVRSVLPGEKPCAAPSAEGTRP